LILGTFQVDAVGLEVSWESAAGAYSLIVAEGVYLTVVCVVFGMLSLSAPFSDMIVDVAW